MGKHVLPHDVRLAVYPALPARPEQTDQIGVQRRRTIRIYRGRGQHRDHPGVGGHPVMAPARPPPAPGHDTGHHERKDRTDDRPPRQRDVPQRGDDGARRGARIAQVVLQR
jgi:hypothetical protein